MENLLLVIDRTDTYFTPYREVRGCDIRYKMYGSLDNIKLKMKYRLLDFKTPKFYYLHRKCRSLNYQLCELFCKHDKKQ